MGKRSGWRGVNPNKGVWINKQYLSYIAFIPNEKAWDYEMKRMGMDPIPEFNLTGTNLEAACQGFKENRRNLDLILVTMRDMSDRDLTYIQAVLTHEAVHVKQYVLRNIGERNPATEQEAYMIEQVSKELMDAFLMTRTDYKEVHWCAPRKRFSWKIDAKA